MYFINLCQFFYSYWRKNTMAYKKLTDLMTGGIKLGHSSDEPITLNMILMDECNIPNFQFGMLYIGHTCISYFIAFTFAILEILSNSRTRRESWGFPCFHIWVLSSIETRVIGFNYFSLRKYFILNVREEIKWLLQNKEIIGGKILKSNK